MIKPSDLSPIGLDADDEFIIDTALKIADAYPVRIATRLLRRPRATMKEYARYWDVEWIDDSRDGDYLEFRK